MTLDTSSISEQCHPYCRQHLSPYRHRWSVWLSHFLFLSCFHFELTSIPLLAPGYDRLPVVHLALPFLAIERIPPSRTVCPHALPDAREHSHVKINHNGALLCPVSETELWGELQNTDLVPSVTEGKGLWAWKFHVYKQSKQGETKEITSHKSYDQFWKEGAEVITKKDVHKHNKCVQTC